MENPDVQGHTTENKEVDFLKPKPIDLKKLSAGQRSELKGGLKYAMMENKAFNVLGSAHKALFYDTCNMIGRPESLAMLNVSGEEYYRNVSIEGQKRKEKKKFAKFTFDFVIPGTSNKLSITKEWRHEDFAL